MTTFTAGKVNGSQLEYRDHDHSYKKLKKIVPDCLKCTGVRVRKVRKIGWAGQDTIFRTVEASLA